MNSGSPQNPNDSQVHIFYGATIPFFSLMILLYIARIYTRRKNFYLEDLFISIAVVLETVSYSIALYISHTTGGHHIVFIPESIQPKVTILTMATYFLNLCASAFVKISIASMLMRFKHSTWWRLSLLACVIISVAAAIAGILTTLLECKPISAQWNHSKLLAGGKCLSQKAINGEAYPIHSLLALSDFVLAIMPLAFVIELTRPLREKIILGSLMATGLIAMVCGIIKMTQLTKGYHFLDLFYYLPVVESWLHIEALLGVIAACIPTLKAPFEKLLLKCGININSTPSGARHGIREVDTMSETGDFDKSIDKSASLSTV